MDFLQIVHPNQGAEIFGQRVSRARFGKHIRLSKLAYEIDLSLSKKQSKRAAGLINEYFNLAGFNAVGLGSEQMLIAYGQLVKLNTLHSLLAFQTWQPPPSDPKPYDYSGRYVAWLVHKLAGRYGWTRHYIFNLWPEEVFCYVQEIMISEYEEIDEKRSLSELGYSTDKTTGKAKFIPTPRPGWMVDEEKSERIYRVPKSIMPVGHIINLEDLVH